MTDIISKSRTTVLGIGNVLWADEGFGVRCAEQFAEKFEAHDDVRVIDGGTQGIYLLDFVTSSDNLLIFDAVDYDLEAGTLHITSGDDVPRFMGAKKMSLHQTGFQEVLYAAQMLGSFPQNIVLIGCQPLQIDDYGGSLTDIVKTKIPQAIDYAQQKLKQWGIHLRDKRLPVEKTALSIESYEQNRPDEKAACRIGDKRFMVQLEKI